MINQLLRLHLIDLPNRWLSCGRWTNSFLLMLIAPPIGCIALSVQTLAQCNEGCGNNGETFLGESALALDPAQSNTAVGFFTLSRDSAGQYNTAMGYEALLNDISGSSNTAMGAFTLFNNTYGREQTA